MTGFSDPTRSGLGQEMRLLDPDCGKAKSSVHRARTVVDAAENQVQPRPSRSIPCRRLCPRVAPELAWKTRKPGHP